MTALDNQVEPFELGLVNSYTNGFIQLEYVIANLVLVGRITLGPAASVAPTWARERVAAWVDALGDDDELDRLADNVLDEMFEIRDRMRRRAAKAVSA